MVVLREEFRVEGTRAPQDGGGIASGQEVGIVHSVGREKGWRTPIIRVDISAFCNGSGATRPRGCVKPGQLLGQKSRTERNDGRN